MQQVQTRTLWENYWLERQNSLRISEGKGRAAAAAFELLRGVVGEGGRAIRMLELGCGEGHILGHLSELCASEGMAVPECVGVDYEPGAIESARRLYPGVSFFVADYAGSPPNLEPFDLVLLIGTLHEVYSSNYSVPSGGIDRALGKEAVRKALRGVLPLVAPGGHLVLFDGVEHDQSPDSEVEVSFRSHAALNEFRKFAAEYEAFRVGYEELEPNGRVRMSVHSFTRYITKTRFINGDLWEIERRESYQYFSADEFRECLAEAGLGTLKFERLSPHRRDWEERVEIKTAGVDFPDEHVLIVARKGRGRGRRARA